MHIFKGFHRFILKLTIPNDFWDFFFYCNLIFIDQRTLQQVNFSGNYNQIKKQDMSSIWNSPHALPCSLTIPALSQKLVSRFLYHRFILPLNLTQRELYRIYPFVSGFLQSFLALRDFPVIPITCSFSLVWSFHFMNISPFIYPLHGGHLDSFQLLKLSL